VLTSAMLSDFTQRRLVVCYRRFGTRIRSHFEGQAVEGHRNRTDRYFGNVGENLPFYAALNYKRAQIFSV